MFQILFQIWPKKSNTLSRQIYLKLISFKILHRNITTLAPEVKLKLVQINSKVLIPYSWALTYSQTYHRVNFP